jgi:hypothetical protein
VSFIKHPKNWNLRHEQKAFGDVYPLFARSLFAFRQTLKTVCEIGTLLV